MSTNDHTVPQMYLRRFARRIPGKAHRIVVAPVDSRHDSITTNVRNVAAIRDFHWGSDPSGVAHHEMERLLTTIETAAAQAFSALLDTDYALPQRWPPRAADRLALSWWTAAQVLRTTRQRKRLAYVAEVEGLEPPPVVGRYAANNPHLGYIASHLAPTAAVVHEKAWGIGFSDACLPTGDVPVIVMNGQDHPDQVKALSQWDILLPLDPHRFLLMPTRGTQADPRTLRDHRLKLDGGMGLFVADLIIAAADRYVFHHPDHEPPRWQDKTRSAGRLPRPWAETESRASGHAVMFTYGALADGITVERQWLTHETAGPTRA